MESEGTAVARFYGWFGSKRVKVFKLTRCFVVLVWIFNEVMMLQMYYNQLCLKC